MGIFEEYLSITVGILVETYIRKMVHNLLRSFDRDLKKLAQPGPEDSLESQGRNHPRGTLQGNHNFSAIL